MFGQKEMAAPRDNLRGAVQQTPVLRSAPSVSPAAVRTPQVSSFDQQIIAQVGEYAQGQLSAAVKIKQERSIMEGQMAHAQGKTFEAVEMAGDKWALEGYRIVDAQTLASSVNMAQMQEIAEGAYEMDPEGYRTYMMGRVEGMLEGITDPRTRELVQGQWLAQMPQLVEAQTTAHLSWKEQKNFESVETGIDVISRDKAATTQLIEFATGGAGTATAGMSDDRRREATVAGVIRAFGNDNPSAYAILAREGLLGDNLTTDQQQQIRAAKDASESRRKQKFDKAYFDAENELMKQIESGAMTPDEAVNAWAALQTEHGFETQAADAGKVYTEAGQGQTTATLTRGLLIDEALLRGDTDAAAAVIIDSLTGTESSGNAGAHRTNQDGKSYGGLLQFGQARLDEVTSGLGIGRISVDQFRNMSAAQQKSINTYHIKDLMAAAQATGAVGKKINGVTVTLSGLVAVAHLGGKGGMQKFVSTNGEYNPEDELGTSLTDYLSKHGAGAMDEMFTPEQRYEQARQTYNTTAEAMQVQAYTAMQAPLSELDRTFKAGGMSREEWQAGREALYQDYGIKRDMATANKEIAMANSVAAEVDEFNGVLQIRQATAQFEEVAKRYEKGEATADELAVARDTLIQERSAIQQANNIPFSASAQMEAVDRVTTRLGEAIKANRKWTEDGVVIDQAIASGTLSGLDKGLQKRALDQNNAQIAKRAQDAIAAGENPDVVAAQANDQVWDFYAKSGLVDENAKRVMNGFLAEPMIDKDGNPNPNFVDAVENYAQLKKSNPTLAHKYLDVNNAGNVAGILARAGGGSIANAVRSVGASMGSSKLSVDPAEYVASAPVQEAIEKSINRFVSESAGGMGDILFGMRQGLDRNAANAVTGSEEDRETLKGAMQRELEVLVQSAPHLSVNELASEAAARVQRSHAYVGGDLVANPDGNNVAEPFFGARADEIMQSDPMALNSAVADWLRTPEARQQYGFLDDSAGLSALWNDNTIVGELSQMVTGLRPFTSFVNPLTGQVVVNVQMADGGYSDPIVIPAERAGQMFMQRMKLTAID